MESRPCRICAAPMVKGLGPGRWPYYCSPACRSEADRRKRGRQAAAVGPCVECGSAISPVGDPRRRYCSDECRRVRDASRQQRSRAELHADPERHATHKAKESARMRRATAARAAARRCRYCDQPLTPGKRILCGNTECKKLYHRDRCREQQRQYRAEARARGESYTYRNMTPEQKQARMEKLAALVAAEDPARRRARKQELWQRRRAQKRSLPFERFRHVDVYERDGWICGICGDPVDRSLEYPDPMSVSLDHVVPFAAGGHHTVENTQCSHLSCNEKKRDRLDPGVTDAYEADALGAG